ncbi:hypothetical protein GS489_32240 [Rhodococcus hoagii]|nr:hypothetical protein [Prescottella equi]
MTGILAQGLRDTGVDGSLDFSTLVPLAIGILAGLIALIAVWRGFKAYLAAGKDGANVTPEERAKAQANILMDAGIAVGAITVGAVVIGFVANLIMRFVG